MKHRFVAFIPRKYLHASECNKAPPSLSGLYEQDKSNQLRLTSANSELGNTRQMLNEKVIDFLSASSGAQFRIGRLPPRSFLSEPKFSGSQLVFNRFFFFFFNRQLEQCRRESQESWNETLHSSSDSKRIQKWLGGILKWNTSTSELETRSVLGRILVPRAKGSYQSNLHNTSNLDETWTLVFGFRWFVFSIIYYHRRAWFSTGPRLALVTFVTRRWALKLERRVGSGHGGLGQTTKKSWKNPIVVLLTGFDGKRRPMDTWRPTTGSKTVS